MTIALALLLGALIGVLLGLLTGLFGVGGGFLINPALVMMLGVAMPIAVGTSLLIIVANSVAGVVSRLRPLSALVRLPRLRRGRLCTRRHHVAALIRRA